MDNIIWEDPTVSKYWKEVECAIAGAQHIRVRLYNHYGVQKVKKQRKNGGILGGNKIASHPQR